MILHLVRRGVTPAAIKRQTGASFSTIQRVRQRQTTEKRRREPIRPARTAEVVAKAAQSLQINPRQSMRAMAKDLGVSEGTVRTIVKEDLGCKSYTRPKRHFISPGAKSRRLERANKLVNKLKHDDARLHILFSDDKFFTLSPYANRRNNHLIWLKGEQEQAADNLRFQQVHQREAGAMFLGIVTSDGKKGPPIWVPEGVKINAHRYQDILREQVQPWIDENYAPGT